MFGQGSGPIAITNVACSGTESGILGCAFSIDVSTCTHGDDAGIRCQESKSVTLFVRQDIRLLLSLLQFALMVQSDWWMAQTSMRAGWRCV